MLTVWSQICAKCSHDGVAQILLQQVLYIYLQIITNFPMVVVR